MSLINLFQETTWEELGKKIHQQFKSGICSQKILIFISISIYLKNCIFHSWGRWGSPSEYYHRGTCHTWRGVSGIQSVCHGGGDPHLQE